MKSAHFSDAALEIDLPGTLGDDFKSPRRDTHPCNPNSMPMFSHVLSFKYLNTLLAAPGSSGNDNDNSNDSANSCWSFACFAVCVKPKTKLLPQQLQLLRWVTSMGMVKIMAHTHTQRHRHLCTHLYNLSAEFFPSSTSCSMPRSLKAASSSFIRQTKRKISFWTF